MVVQAALQEDVDAIGISILSGAHMTVFPKVYQLMVEKGFAGTYWLSETILVPFVIFQLMSTLKNASLAGFIKLEVLNNILDKFDNHKGTR